MDNYLHNLTLQLAQGLSRQPQAFRARHAAYLTHKQNPDGGFSGREGESDLYYTSFALRGLALLEALSPEIANRAAGFLQRSLTAPAGIIDFFSLLYSSVVLLLAGNPNVLASAASDWPERVAAFLESLRTKDGGYAKAPGANSGSTYHTFLVALCYEVLGKDLPDRAAALAFVRSRRREDGGFVEIAPMRRSGVNPTAAAVGLLHMLVGPNLPADEAEPTIAFLAQMPSFEGGLRANDRIPLADLLSTFTGCWTLARLGALERIDRAAALHYVYSLENQTGGFRGGAWDTDIDVEYTFYGLGAVALLAG